MVLGLLLALVGARVRVGVKATSKARARLGLGFGWRRLVLQTQHARTEG